MIFLSTCPNISSPPSFHPYNLLPYPYYPYKSAIFGNLLPPRGSISWILPETPLSHRIGLDYKKPYKRHGRYFYRPYRNYYDASVKDCETWDLLVQAGYAEAGRKDRYGGRMYWLSRAGLDALGEYLGIKIYDEED